MRMRWENDFQLSTAIQEGEIVISANRNGMRSLANILMDLSDQEPGAHVHLDEHNSLEDGSIELVIQRVP
ncbi:MAG: hypothetical protein Q4A01_10240 [Coriobacteriales bacterium]|nr:hypothetical protein [Coriobacteriales bacterium]